MSSDPFKTVLITGASAGGIGSALAIAFQRRNFHVFAAVRTPQKAAHLASLPNVTLLSLDVTSPTSIATAVEYFKQKTDGKGLDILVNNSGVGYTMPLVDASLGEGRKLFEVNFWGMLAMVQAFVPLLIIGKHGGTVLNISSVGGEVHTPWIGLYSASKAATTSFSETLRLELAPLNVKVVTAMVGTVTSKFFVNTPELQLPPNSYYQPIQKQIAAIATGKNITKAMDGDTFAARVVADVLGGKEGRIWRGSTATAVRYVSKFVPTFIVVSLFLHDSLN